MATITKTLSSKVDASGLAQVLFLARHGRNIRVRVKSGIFVPIQFWNEKKQNISIPQKVGASIKAELETLKESLEIAESRTAKIVVMYGETADKHFIESALSLLKDYKGTITEEIINEKIQEQKRETERTAKDVAEMQRKEKKYLFNYCEPFLSKGYSEPRIRLYRVIFRSMARYSIYRNKVLHKPFEWDIDKVTREDMEQLFSYFANENKYRVKYARLFDKEEVIYNEENKAKHKNKDIKERGENRVIDMKKCVRTFWNWLIKTGATTNNPLAGIEVGTQKFGTPYYLTIEERNKIAEFDFSNNRHLEIQRDIFIFQCFVGCRVGDLKTLTIANIVDGVLIYTPHKTKDHNESMTARVPLNDRALALIEKYKGCDEKGRLFPFIADQNYNDAIKDILTACEITRMVNVRNSLTGETEMKPINEIASSHMARRTFVGCAYKVVKDPNLIGRMSGHVEGSKAFVRYRDIDDDMLREVIKAIE